MLETIPEPPKEMLTKARVSAASFSDRSGGYACVVGSSKMTQYSIEWWVYVAPKAMYVVPVNTGRGTTTHMRLTDGVSAMCLIQSGDTERMNVLLPLDEDDTEILLIYLMQKGVHVPWDELYRSAECG